MNLPALVLVLTGLLATPSLGAAQTVVWSIGQPDGETAELALGPGNFSKFKEDGWFVVGDSASARDWPYVQPGPVDDWAGSRSHTFVIQFALAAEPIPGDYKLRLKIADAQNAHPPELRISINGAIFDRPLSAGTGDESVRGEPRKGKAQEIAIPFREGNLRRGDNAISITTEKGSWFLYDSVSLEAPGAVLLSSVQSRTILETAKPLRALKGVNDVLLQPVLVRVRHKGPPEKAVLRVQGTRRINLNLREGVESVEALVPAVSRPETRHLELEIEGQVIGGRNIRLDPVHKLTIYVLPHSHTDIGYTEIQTAIEKKQVNNLLEGIAAAKKTARYPAGARFVWNVEVLWAADLYLHRLSESQRFQFREAVTNGWVALNGMYLNELTGLCRPEELLRIFRYATQLSDECGVSIDSAMISDVPGYTWGTVTAMSQAGIKYFSVAPNFFDRIGDILQKWENKPFYWVSPSGRNKVLVWIPFKGYAMSHIYKQLSPEFVASYQAQLEQTDYPYEITYMRWSGHGDNATPDPAICDFIKDWNSKYTYPRFVIASTSDAFRAFEDRYGNQVPTAKGDWTPYWEDGAGSSAFETALNRATAERLTQAESLWAMRSPRNFPPADFDAAWNSALLYSEHTWGASMSVSDPENPKTKEQWEIKRGYAMKADQESRRLLAAASIARPSTASQSLDDQNLLDVYNTTSSDRSRLVSIAKEMSAGRDHVTDAKGAAIPSQRLVNGDLAFYANNVPSFAGRRFVLSRGPAVPADDAKADGLTLDNGTIHVRLDSKSGGIAELLMKGLQGNLADTNSGYCLNDYLFLQGSNVANLQLSGVPRISIKETGPLVASLLVDGEAPGCRKLTREIRLEAEADYVEVIDTVDKERAAIPPRPGDWHFAQNGGKESVNFAFCFNVPDGDIHLDIPLAVMQPEAQQIAGSCKNWFTVSRWLDVANENYGITWVTMDAPLVELGGITANLLGSQGNPEVWRKKVGRTQKVYSWVMNNHWGTNYRAYQNGPTVFRYILRPHRNKNADDATDFALGFTQPLLVFPGAAGSEPPSASRLKLQPSTKAVAFMKPADDGSGIIVRLFGAAEAAERVKLSWSEPKPKSIWMSDTSEKRRRNAGDEIEVPGHELVTVRAEF